MNEAPEGMTFVDLVRKHLPDVTEQQVDFILWEKTRYPVVPWWEVEEDVKQFARENKDSRSHTAPTSLGDSVESKQGQIQNQRRNDNANRIHL